MADYTESRIMAIGLLTLRMYYREGGSLAYGGNVIFPDDHGKLQA
jgi:hypothetical protein